VELNGLSTIIYAMEDITSSNIKSSLLYITMAWNGGLVVLAGFLIKKWINNVDEGFKEARAQAEKRAEAFQSSLDKIEGCVGNVKVELAGKVDQKEHEHFCYEKTTAMWDAIKSAGANGKTKEVSW